VSLCHAHCPLTFSSCSDEKFAQSFVTKEALGFPVIFTELLLQQNFGYLTVCYGIDGPFIEDKHEDLPIFLMVISHSYVK
jgi:hypothetical protein